MCRVEKIYNYKRKVVIMAKEERVVYVCDLLSRIDFSLASFVQACTKPGSHERDIAQRIHYSIRYDVKEVLEVLNKEGWKDKPVVLDS